MPYYKSHNKGMGNVLTLRNGRYNEFITLPKQINVGGAVYHTRQRKIVSWEKNRQQAVLPPDVVGRWLSPNPLASKYPNMSTYNFVANSTILFIDPGGLEWEIVFQS